ncbi:hypothetical protein Tco_1348100 [Tanacetum coccineum]
MPSAPSLDSSSDDLYLITEEFEASEPSDTKITSPHSIDPSDSTTPLSPDHPLAQTLPASTRASYYRSTARIAVRTQPTLSLGMSARIAEAAALSPSSFRKRYRSSYETPSPSSFSTLPIQKRYRGTLELVEDTEEDEEEEATPEGQQQAVLIVDTVADKPLGLGYGALRCHELALGEGSVPSTFDIGQSSRYMSEHQRVEETPTPRPRVRATWVDHVDDTFYTDILVDVPPVRVPVQTPPSPEWSSVSLPVSPSSPVVPTLVASPVTTPVATISIGEDEFLEVGAQLELHGSILHDHTQRLGALPPTLFESYDRDLKELYTRLRDVKDEIFSQRYRLRSLEQEQEQERATVTFSAKWRPVLALELWVGYVNTKRAEMWQARYDD